MWNDLTMQQRADVISMAVKAGMRDMRSIRSFYDETSKSRRFEDGSHLFADGGIKKYTGDSEDIGYDANSMKFYERATGKELGDSAIFDEVIVNGRNRINDYLTEANDNTSVYNVPHREYNLHLKNRAEQGAREAAIWREEHPTMSAWGDAAASVPLAVASVPLIAGGAEALAGTSAGQAISSGLLSLSNLAKGSTIAGAPAWAWADAGLTSAFAAHGIDELSKGNVTPEALLEVAPLGQLAKPLYKGVLKSGIRQYNPRHVIKQITAENAASLTPEQWTAAQDAAIARGDMVEAQRLRDLHGTVNGYHSGFYHETKAPFVKFNRPGKNSTGDLLSPFGVFTKRTNKLIGLGGYQMPLNVRYKNPLHVKDKRELFEILPKDLQKEINTLYKYQFHNTDQLLWNKRAFSAKQKIGKFLSDNNYDALIMDKDWAGTGLVESERWTDATIVPSPGRVKSADAVTFGDNGIRIPLGERDNFNINDIRYGLLPFGIGLTGLGLTNEE